MLTLRCRAVLRLREESVLEPARYVAVIVRSYGSLLI